MFSCPGHKAPYVGVSLYTWTTVIGVVLAGMTVGNYLGGWLADRHASLRLLGLVFLLAGLVSLGMLAVDTLGVRLAADWPIVVQILVLTGGLFLLPSVLLGMISPMVAKLAVRDLARTGRTVGRIYAAGAAGSIAGTFATGYWLIAWCCLEVGRWRRQGPAAGQLPAARRRGGNAYAPKRSVGGPASIRAVAVSSAISSRSKASGTVRPTAKTVSFCKSSTGVCAESALATAPGAWNWMS